MTSTYPTKDEALAALRSGDAKQRMSVTDQAKAEHADNKGRKEKGVELAPTPALDALNEDTANGTKKRTTKARLNAGSGGKAVNLTDEQLAHEVVPELWAAGHRTVGAMVKALRGTDRGTNPKRFAKAFAVAVEAKLIDPESVKAEKVAAAKAALPRATSKDPSKTAPRPKAAAKSAKAMGAEDEVSKRRATRVRKAS